MKSRIWSRTEYLIPTYNILVLILHKFDSKSSFVGRLSNDLFIQFGRAFFFLGAL